MQSSAENNSNSCLSPRSLLSPLAGVYGMITSARNSAYNNWWFASTKSSLPVICVGNVTVGGSGKTPFTAYLTRELYSLGRRPVVLTRGYRGKCKGPHLVSPCDSPVEVGDEALLHARNLESCNVPVVIARDRVLGASYIEYNQLGDIIILDDGYQHRRLERDVNVLLLDVSTEKSINRWLNGKLLPAGYLREPLDEALARADCVVFVNRLGAAKKELGHLTPYLHMPSNIPVIQFSLSPSHIVDVASGARLALSTLEDKRASALTAIGNPDHFFTTLETLGVRLSEKLSYRDHHSFSEREWTKALSAGGGCVLTTEKDAVKLRRFVNKNRQLLALVLKAEFNVEAHERQLLDLITSKVESPAERYEHS